MGLWRRIFGGHGADRALAPLYGAIVAEARTPRWYADCGVADTLDGRFDMVSTVLALVLIRLEALGEPGREPSARLAELFIADMDGQLRQEGIGDLVVGKHIGRMMGQVGGRFDAYRMALTGVEDLGSALDRNVHRAAGAAPAARALLEQGVRALAERVGRLDLATMIAGRLA